MILLYNQPYFMPGFYSHFTPFMMRSGMGPMPSYAIRGLGAGRGIGLFNRIGNGISALKGVNWSGIINNTSRTLGVINQAIPVVKQVGPMINNMKSMLRVASIFKDETDGNIRKKQGSYKKNYSYNNSLKT